MALPPTLAPGPSSARSATAAGLGILASRVVGFLRQRAVAHYFGAGPAADVLTAAFRVGNVAQNLLGEGALSASFVPVYARLTREDPLAAAAFARAALGALGLAIAAVSAAGLVFAEPLALTVAAGFDAEHFALTAEVVRIVIPMTALLALGAWGLGVLTTHRRFFLPYAAPMLWSVAQIATLVVLAPAAPSLGWLARALAWSALAGAILQGGVLLVAAARSVGGPWSGRALAAAGNPHLREAARKLPAALLGRGAMQLSGLLDTFLVGFAGAGATAALGFAQAIHLLPMSVLGTGEAAALLPDVARASADVGPESRRTRDSSAQQALSFSLSRVWLLAAPVTVAFCLFGDEVVAVLFRTGRFDDEATRRVSTLLVVYGCALVANASGRVVATTLFAIGDATTPARFALVRVVVSAVLAIASLSSLGAVGVVGAAAVAAWVEAALLTRALRREVGTLRLGGARAGRIALLALGLALVGLGARAAAALAFEGPALRGLVVLGAMGVAFVGGSMWLGFGSLRTLLRRR